MIFLSSVPSSVICTVFIRLCDGFEFICSLARNNRFRLIGDKRLMRLVHECMHFHLLWHLRADT